MICDLCDKDQQNICERTFHFIKPINECLMRKAQENREIIEELEKIREEIKTNRDEWIKGQDAEWHTYDRCLVIIDKHIRRLNNECNY